MALCAGNRLLTWFIRVLLVGSVPLYIALYVRSQDQTRSHDLVRTQDPIRTQGLIRTQDPIRTRDLIQARELVQTNAPTRFPDPPRPDPGSPVVQAVDTANTVSGDGHALLTLFTTIKDRAPRVELHKRLVTNWASLKPDIRPVLMVPGGDNDTKWPTEAARVGWEVRTTARTYHGIPIVKEMFLGAINTSDTPFVGFANADIIFDDGLARNIRYLHQLVLQNPDTPMLVVGARTNINITATDLGDGSDLARIQDAARLTRHFHGKAIDYFITTRSGFPWSQVPDFVVGKNGYDNWLLAKAQEWSIPLIDLSKTLVAVHQVGSDGVRSGTKLNRGTRHMNKALVEHDFKYKSGNIGCAHLSLVCVDYLVPTVKCSVHRLQVVGKPRRAKFCGPRIETPFTKH